MTDEREQYAQLKSQVERTGVLVNDGPNTAQEYLINILVN